MLIECLMPRVTRERATGLLRGGAWRRGGLRAVIDFYVPYRLFRVSIANGRRSAELSMAVDAVTGRLDPYRFDGPPPQSQRVVVETRRAAPAALGEGRARIILEESVRRGVYLRGFFGVQSLSVTCGDAQVLHVPYWVGLYARGEEVGVEAVDALRGTVEGAKVREVVAAWLAAPRAA